MAHESTCPDGCLVTRLPADRGCLTRGSESRLHPAMAKRGPGPRRPASRAPARTGRPVRVGHRSGVPASVAGRLLPRNAGPPGAGTPMTSDQPLLQAGIPATAHQGHGHCEEAAPDQQPQVPPACFCSRGPGESDSSKTAQQLKGAFLSHQGLPFPGHPFEVMLTYRHR